MIAISLLLAILDKGAGTLQTAMQVPTISDIITGIFLFCMWPVVLHQLPHTLQRRSQKGGQRRMNAVIAPISTRSQRDP